MDSVFSHVPRREAPPAPRERLRPRTGVGVFTDGTAWAAPGVNDDPVWFGVTRRLHPDADGPWSWWTYRGQAFDTDAGWRIDYQAATKPMLERAVTAIVEKPSAADRRWTDHAPVIVEYR